jgi:hypothetical protein
MKSGRPAAIELSIGELVLEGVSRADGYRAIEVFRVELQQRLESLAVSTSWEAFEVPKLQGSQPGLGMRGPQSLGSDAAGIAGGLLAQPAMGRAR